MPLDHDPLELARPNGDDLEPALECLTRRVPGKPGLSGEAQPSQLLLVDHLERVADPSPVFPFTSQNTSRRPRPDDQVELVPAGPDVGVENAVAAEAIVAGGALLIRCVA